MANILVLSHVNDENDAVIDYLRQEGHDVVACDSAETAGLQMSLIQFDIFFVSVLLYFQLNLTHESTDKPKRPFDIVLMANTEQLEMVEKLVPNEINDYLRMPLATQTELRIAINKSLARIENNRAHNEPINAVAHSDTVTVQSMEALEREHIQKALKATSGNRRKAAEMLGIGLRTLYDKLKRYSLNERANYAEPRVNIPYLSAI